MLTASQAFKDASIRSHQATFKVEYSIDGGSWTELTDWNGHRVALTGGTIRLVRQSLVRRAGTLTFGGRTAYPDTVTHPLGPRSLLRVYKGVVLGASTEWLLLGTFQVVKPSTSWPNLAVSCAIVDEMHNVEGDTFPHPITPVPTQTRWKVLERLLTHYNDERPGVLPDDSILPVFPGRTVRVTDGYGGLANPVGDLTFDTNRADAIDAIADAGSRAIWLDYDGAIRVDPRTVYSSGTPVYAFTAGDGGDYTELGTAWSLEGFANAAAVRWAGGVQEGWATTGEMTPWLLGRTYRRTWDITDSDGTQAQANSYVDQILGTYYGRGREVNAQTLVLPWLEPSDIVSVTTPQTATIDAETTTQVIDEVSIPLDPGGTMAVKLREWRPLEAAGSNLVSNDALADGSATTWPTMVETGFAGPQDAGLDGVTTGVHIDWVDSPTFEGANALVGTLCADVVSGNDYTLTLGVSSASGEDWRAEVYGGGASKASSAWVTPDGTIQFASCTWTSTVTTIPTVVGTDYGYVDGGDGFVLNLTLIAPSWQANDVCLIQIMTSDQNASGTTTYASATGWTQVEAQTNTADGTNSKVRTTWLHRKLLGTDTIATFSIGATSGTQEIAYSLIVLRHCDLNLTNEGILDSDSAEYVQAYRYGGLGAGLTTTIDRPSLVVTMFTIDGGTAITNTLDEPTGNAVKQMDVDDIGVDYQAHAIWTTKRVEAGWAGDHAVVSTHAGWAQAAVFVVTGDPWYHGINAKRPSSGLWSDAADHTIRYVQVEDVT